jgi:hypothetical protein
VAWRWYQQDRHHQPPFLRPLEVEVRWPRSLRLNISRDKNRRYIGKSQPKRPPTRTHPRAGAAPRPRRRCRSRTGARPRRLPTQNHHDGQTPRYNGWKCREKSVSHDHERLGQNDGATPRKWTRRPQRSPTVATRHAKLRWARLTCAAVSGGVGATSGFAATLACSALAPTATATWGEKDRSYNAWARRWS